MKIPISTPTLGDLETRYVMDALGKKEISGHSGEYIAKFEEQFARYCECQSGISTNSGTTALHLALASIGVGPGDEVLVSTLTNMATFFAVLYQGARPIPIDIEFDTCNMDPSLLESRITPRTKAILVVHLYGHPADMDPIMGIAKRHNLRVIEDCAEAHGAVYRGKKVGTFGDAGCFSFYGNKIITTGEGGMITTNDPEIAAKARSLRSLAFGSENKFMHEAIGFSYRMTNVQGAIGCAQMTRIEDVIEAKRRLAHFYSTRLSQVAAFSLPVERPGARNVYWMYHVVLKPALAAERSRIMAFLSASGVEVREGFAPYNAQEIFIKKGWTHPTECPRAVEIGKSGFYLPSSPNLSDDELEFVVQQVKSSLSS